MRCAFLPANCSVMENGKLELMHHMIHPKLPGVYFLGFIQAHGPMIPCFEAQMPYAADLIQAGSPFSVLHCKHPAVLCKQSNQVSRP